VSGGSWLDGAGEASERALFARRARTLPEAPVPSLDAILAAADAPACPARTRSAQSERRAGGRARARAIATFALVAAACAAGFVLAGRTAGQRRASIVASDVDASAPSYAGWASTGGAACEPAAEEEDRGASCALQASFVLASSDQASHACSQPEKPARAASFASMSVDRLACERGPEMSYR
jgi:hypothetical protein